MMSAITSPSCMLINVSDTNIKPTDILLGKGKLCSTHVGNIAFKFLVEAGLPAYMAETTQSRDRTFLIVEFVETIHAQGGRFLKNVKGSPECWTMMNKQDAREKVRNVFCNAAKTKKKTEQPISMLSPYRKFTEKFDQTSSFREIVVQLGEDLHGASTSSSHALGEEKPAAKAAQHTEPTMIALPALDDQRQDLPPHQLKVVCTNTQPKNAAASPLIPRIGEKTISCQPRAMRVKTINANQEAATLQLGNIITETRQTDILVGKRKYCTYNLGTIAFKVLVDVKVCTYMDKEMESCDKTAMTVEMLKTIHEEGGRFLKEVAEGGSCGWLELNKKEAREKIRHAFRDAFVTQRIERPGALLSKIAFRAKFNKNNSFSDILRELEQDPAVVRFIKASEKRDTSSSRDCKNAAVTHDTTSTQGG